MFKPQAGQSRFRGRFQVLLICTCLTSLGPCSFNNGFFPVLLRFNPLHFLNEKTENIANFFEKKNKRKLSGRKERERDGTTFNSSFAALAGIKDVAAKIVRHTIARLTSVRGFSLIGLGYFSHCGKQTTSLNQSLRGFFPFVLRFIPLRLSLWVKTSRTSLRKTKWKFPSKKKDSRRLYFTRTVAAKTVRHTKARLILIH